jgi:sterol desaturase/sphingolipid hydroxylase (fatty acid hydroxylase superfamily)
VSEIILKFEAYIRLGFFFGVFGVVALSELLAPRRKLTTSKSARWVVNCGIVFIDTVAVRLLFSAGAVGFAFLAQDRGWGLLNMLAAPFWLKVVAGAIALDFIIYMQHVIFHFIPLLWRLHMMHHADLDYDVTTGTRFHPVEILISMFIKIGAIFFLGAAPVAVLIFEVLLNATAMFNHGNIRIPVAVDSVLRLFVVTPDMHRVHHSVIIKEFNSNFGFNLPIWDRLFGTYRAQPMKGHEGMTIGLSWFRDPAKLGLGSLLLMPFRGRK